MKLVVIFVQAVILWVISLLCAFLGGCFLILWHQDQEEKESNSELKLNEDGPRTYGRVYDSESRNWSEDPEVNALFLKTVHNYLFDRLKSRGHVFLNEALDELGMPRFADGQVYGWANPDMEDSLWIVDPVEGGEKKSYIIHFKTDGPILDLAG